MQRPIKASVTGLMILTALSAGCAKKEDRAAQAATRAEQPRLLQVLIKEV